MAKTSFLSALAGVVVPTRKSLSPVDNRGGWWPWVREPFSGAWQRNIEIEHDTVVANHAVFACMTLIASDIAKLRIKLVQKDSDGIWSEISNPAYSPVLRKPNGFQTRIQFMESWMLSKLSRGNTYVLKKRDLRGVVNGLYVLDPTRVRPLISSDGSIFYQLYGDDLNQIEDSLVVPARDIIHDRFNCLFHPLVGLSPIFANGLAAVQGLKMQEHSARFFGNNANPGGILTAPGEIDDDTAKRLKEYWESNYTGKNAGKIAVLGDGLKYQQLQIAATDAQLVEQLKWSAEVVCSTFHVPGFLIGVGAEPTYNNVSNLTLRYYSQCLQKLMEDAEACLDEGLGMDGVTLGTEFDEEALMRLDAMTQMDVLEKSKGKLTVNEQRKRLNQKPVAGGDTVYLQEQDHSLEWLLRRDALPIEGDTPPEPEPPQKRISALKVKAMFAGNDKSRKAA
ncbi:phage portal protein [Brucella pseudintermedia]|uniref:phage portal protein n=1 Tax=Brucella pseudintermedia TaxID=370111 RepID=UPI00124F26DA|nr:phage portal protein [Brucella pseudintermedia]KAB2680333.1 phage portal protein [Brucella pseudintermedia]